MSKEVYEHILETEYACHCCGQLPPRLKQDLRLIVRFFDEFVRLRHRWGKSLIVTSGYRCQKHNAEVGGGPLSAHQFGLAFDVYFLSAEERDRFVALVEKEAKYLRMGTYKHTDRMVHIDMAYLIQPSATDFWSPGVRWVK